GPIWKNKIFFFANYEKFTRITPPTNTGLTPNSADVAAIDARFQAINAAAGTKYDWGTWSNSLTNKAEDKKKLAKIDWNIVEGQRLSVRYSETSGAVPQFGNFSNTSYTGVSSSNTAGGTTGYTSNFYSQSRVEKAWATQLFSQWTPDFKTEAKYSTTKQDQLTPTVATLPEIHIFGVGGIDSGGFSITNGAIIAGTEQFRQGNIIHLKTDSYALSGDYFWNKFTFTGGFDREKSSFYNLFRAGSYGRFDYASISAFQSDTISAFSRAYYVQGTPQADLSDFAVTGLFGQAKWDVTPRLNILAGARYDFVQSGTKPPYNALFQSTFGNRNDGTVDGTNSFSPRIAVNYAIDDDRKTQLRGGFGHVLGRAPWVFFSNSYSAPGVGRFTSLTAPTSLVSYLQNGFDPANPIGSATSIPATGRYEVDYADQKIKLPSVWRGNIAIDRKIPQIDSILTLEYIQTRNDQDLWISNDNIKPTTLGADGRQRYAGSVNTQANALHPEFLNVYHTRNVSIGRSRYWSLSLDRPMKDGWGFDVSYTDGHALDAQPNGGTTASGIWGPNPVFNQNTIEPARSEFEIRNRIQVQISKKIELVKKWPTVVSLYYEGRSGNPFSFTYSNDLNGDGQSGNDLVAVPKDNTDARFDFSKMSQADQDAYFAYLKNTGLMKYAGTVAPRNAFLQPWISRLDLHFSQTIPIYHPAQVELFLDFVNFGTWISSSLFNYYEKAPQSSNDTDWRQYAGSASYAADGRIVPVFSSTTPPSSTSQIIDNIQSRWRIQVGARLKF
ncbi:MAG TPA: hypothetical protein VKC60_08975, partial [Opitutaceae bacterium]|nr:hypothetical protein [Opitutaceae bacterium]